MVLLGLDGFSSEFYFLGFGTTLCLGGYGSGVGVLLGTGTLGEFAEAVYTTSGVYELLLTRVEWVSVRADFGGQRLLDRTGLEHGSASTGSSTVREIVWVNLGLHSGTIKKGTIITYIQYNRDL